MLPRGSLRPNRLRQLFPDLFSRGVGNGLTAHLTKPVDRAIPNTNFRMLDATYVPEFDITLVRMKHGPTHAEYLHVDSADTNNSFNVVFHTPVTDSTGVPHILEHVVLCGSERYRVRDPFFKMLKRSLSTFMNAMTAQDYTMYPFSTQNAKDYENLMRVYLDATFFPLLRRGDFHQEGHRVELDKETGALKRTGVVYNEMKGAYSDSSSLFSTRLQQSLFGEGSPQGHVSGGDPDVIPRLTYDNLKAFYEKNYRPWNCMFVTYGDLDFLNHIALMEEAVLSRFTPPPSGNSPIQQFPPSPVPPTPLKKDLHIRVSADDEKDDRVKIARSWHVRPSSAWIGETASDVHYRQLKGKVLSSLLLNGSQSPVYAALIDAQVAPDFSPTVGFDLYGDAPVFTLGAQGVRGEEGVARVEETIERALRGVESFPPERVDAIVHQLELSVRQKKTNFGLSVASSASAAWAAGGFSRVVGALSLAKQVKRLRAEPLESWTRLTKEWVLDGWNDYDVRVTATPDPSFSFRDGLSGFPDSDRPTVDVTGEKTSTVFEDVNVLPTLGISDVSREMPEKVQLSTLRAVDSYALNQQTNGIVYGTTYLPFHNIPAEERRLVPLLALTLGSVDAGKRTYRDVALDLERFGGDFSVSPLSTTTIEASRLGGETRQKMGAKRGLLVKHFALKENARKSFTEVVGDVLTASRFDDPFRLESLVRSYYQGLVSGMPQAAMGYARLIASRGWGPAQREAHELNGVPKLAYLRERFGLASEVAEAESNGKNKEVYEKLGADLTAMFKEVVVGWGGGGEPQTLWLGEAKEDFHFVDEFWGRFREVTIERRGTPTGAREFDNGDLRPFSYVAMKLPVHYCAATVNTGIKYGDARDVHLQVLAQILKHDFLHGEVREKGGAYGTGASADVNGIFEMTSYWDPNCGETLRAFRRGLAWLGEKDRITPRMRDEALLSIFQDLDAPQGPSRKGMSEFLGGITTEMAEARRARYLDLASSGERGLKELREVAVEAFGGLLEGNEDLFVRPKEAERGRVAVGVVGKEESLEKLGVRDEWETVKV